MHVINKSNIYDNTEPCLLLSAIFMLCKREIPRLRLWTFLIPARLFLKEDILKLSGLKLRFI